MADSGLTANSNVAGNAKPKKKKHFRWLNRCAYLLVLFGILGWLAPTIVAVKELQSQVARLLLANFPGRIELGETSLDWFSPIVIKNLFKGGT